MAEIIDGNEFTTDLYVNTDIEIDMLNTIIDKNPIGIIVSQNIFNTIEEEEEIYVLGHFYIKVKDIKPPFCPIYLCPTLNKDSYLPMNNDKECDQTLLKLFYGEYNNAKLANKNRNKIS